MKYLKLSGFLLLLTILGSSAVTAQDLDAATVKNIVEAKNFVFKAQYVSPLNGRTVALTSDYDVVVNSNQVVSYLPYFGRAYSAPINGEGGIKFTSNSFDYSHAMKKKKWEVRIRPRDVTDVQDMYLTIFDNGRASLRVNNTNRQSISYDGYIVEGKSEKKAF
jgi:hypothetical protein